MKRRLRVLVIIASVIAMGLAFNVGAASAGHSGTPRCGSAAVLTRESSGTAIPGKLSTPAAQ